MGESPKEASMFWRKKKAPASARFALTPEEQEGLREALLKALLAESAYAELREAAAKAGRKGPAFAAEGAALKDAAWAIKARVEARVEEMLA